MTGKESQRRSRNYIARPFNSNSDTKESADQLSLPDLSQLEPELPGSMFDSKKNDQKHLLSGVGGLTQCLYSPNNSRLTSPCR